VLDEAAVIELREDAQAGGKRTIQEIVGKALPIALADDWEKWHGKA